MGITETGDRPSPVFPFPKGRPFLSGDRLSMADQTRAFPACHDFGGQRIERIGLHRGRGTPFD